uniref:Progestin and adipoQ receptor family member 3 n=2 Tax=Cacopsylla melanoneura TaxID=428564 RepID=A0A8D8M094_9HEMI
MKIKKNANEECINAADTIEVFKPRKDKERLSDSDSDEAEAQTRRPGSSDPPSHSPSTITLLSYHEAPIHLRFNPYILSGYRGYLSTKMCIESIFWMTNETINIWSHIFGWMLFLALTMYDLFLLNLQASVFDKFIVGLLLCCFQICMVTSTLYHVFSCKSERHFHNFLCFDLFGIALSLLAIYLTGVYYAFWCHKEWQYFYLATVFVIFIACMIMQIPRLNVDPNLKMIMFVCWAAYGVVPTVHWALIMNPIVSVSHVNNLLGGVWCCANCSLGSYYGRLGEPHCLYVAPACGRNVRHLRSGVPHLHYPVSRVFLQGQSRLHRVLPPVVAFLCRTRSVSLA